MISLLLSRSSELLESKDASGKSGLHIASIHGHTPMVEVLLGQGAEIDAIDKVNCCNLFQSNSSTLCEIVPGCGGHFLFYILNFLIIL